MCLLIDEFSIMPSTLCFFFHTLLRGNCYIWLNLWSDLKCGWFYPGGYCPLFCFLFLPWRILSCIAFSLYSVTCLICLLPTVYLPDILFNTGSCRSLNELCQKVVCQRNLYTEGSCFSIFLILYIKGATIYLSC